MELSNYKIIYLLNAIAMEAQLKSTKFGFDNWEKQQNYNSIKFAKDYGIKFNFIKFNFKL
jgi:hypothetical protein